VKSIDRRANSTQNTISAPEQPNGGNVKNAFAPTFRHGDLEGNAGELMTFFGLKNERDIAAYMESFTIVTDGLGMTDPVTEGKYKSAMLLLYFQVLSDAHPGSAFRMTNEMGSLLCAYFGEARIEDALQPTTKHTTIRALIGGEVTVQIAMV